VCRRRYEWTPLAAESSGLMSVSEVARTPRAGVVPGRILTVRSQAVQPHLTAPSSFLCSARPDVGTSYCNRYSNTADTPTDLREPVRTSHPGDLREQHVEGCPRTDRLALGVKGSQVQILSARQ
jgi:hypothetical protein